MPQRKKVGRAPTLNELPASELKDRIARTLSSIRDQVADLRLETQNRRYAELVQGAEDLDKLLAQLQPLLREVRRRLKWR